SYVSRMVNLTTLAPDIVAAMLVETPSLEHTRFDLEVDPPRLCEERWNRIDEAMTPRSQDESCG
ncbi:MAG: hypothetical protein ACREBC_18695, partial [Pyrinomonadaceae bacterium]